MSDEDYLRRQREMLLTTRGRRTGKAHTVELWFVAADGLVYLMTYARRHGRGTDWYRNLRRHGAALIAAGERRYEARLERVDNPEAALEEITEMFAGKYGWQAVRSYYTETKRIPVKLRIDRVES